MMWCLFTTSLTQICLKVCKGNFEISVFPLNNLWFLRRKEELNSFKQPFLAFPRKTIDATGMRN